MIDTKVIMDPGDLNDHRVIWDRLFNETTREPSTSFEWTKALMVNHSALYTRFFLVVFQQNHDITGILPLITREDRLLGRRVVTLSPISELYNTHSDWLVTNDSDKVAKALLKTLSRLPFQWDLFRMTKFLDGHPLLESLKNALGEQRLRYRIQRQPPSFYLPLGNSMDHYLGERSGKFRNHLKRMRKKLSAKGNVRFINIDKTADFDRAYRVLLDIESNSWKHQHGTAISNIERQTGFYRDLCYKARENGHLHLLFLYVDESPIAYDLGFIQGERYSYLKTSFDERYKPFSPATILRARLIETLIDQGVRVFDFPGEPYTWEKQWTDQVRWHHSLVVFNKTMTARIYNLLTTIKNRRHTDSGKDDIDYCDPRDLQAPGN